MSDFDVKKNFENNSIVKIWKHIFRKSYEKKKKLLEQQIALEKKNNAIKNLSDMLYKFVEDGILSVEEEQTINDFLVANSLSLQDVKNTFPAVYARAALSFSNEPISENEYVEMQKIQDYLGVQDADIGATKSNLHRLLLINEYNNGRIPNIINIQALLRKNEKGLWEERGSIIEEKVVRSGYVGGSRGVSIRVAKGLTYRVGTAKGELIKETANVVTSQGVLTITNQRIIFSGDKKSFAKPIKSLINYELFSDGMRFHFTTGKPFLVKTYRDVSDVIAAAITCVINLD